MKLSFFIFLLHAVLSQRNSSMSRTSIESTRTSQTSEAESTTSSGRTTTTTVEITSSEAVFETSTTNTRTPVPVPTETAQKQDSSTSQNAFIITGLVVGSAIVIAGLLIFLFRKFGLKPSRNFKNRLRRSSSPVNHSGGAEGRKATFARPPVDGGGFATYETEEIVPVEPVPTRNYGNVSYHGQYYADQNGYNYKQPYENAVGVPYVGYAAQPHTYDQSPPYFPPARSKD
jgi:hypothetical protein